METTTKISALHKRIDLLELGLNTLSKKNLTEEKTKEYKLAYLNKIKSNYEKIQILIELKKADLSVMIRDVNLSSVNLSRQSNQYECKYLVSSLGRNGII